MFLMNLITWKVRRAVVNVTLRMNLKLKCILADQLCYIFNLFFQTGILTMFWKQAKVTSVLKSVCDSKATSYKSVSILNSPVSRIVYLICPY